MGAEELPDVGAEERLQGLGWAECLELQWPLLCQGTIMGPPGWLEYMGGPGARQEEGKDRAGSSQGTMEAVGVGVGVVPQ